MIASNARVKPQAKRFPSHDRGGTASWAPAGAIDALA
jgi:hypothetical protein